VESRSETAGGEGAGEVSAGLPIAALALMIGSGGVRNVVDSGPVPRHAEGYCTTRKAVRGIVYVPRVRTAGVMIEYDMGAVETRKETRKANTILPS
jgi:hypothetical protein